MLLAVLSAVGGFIGVPHFLEPQLPLPKIDEHLHLLKVHLPYHESDHVLNLAYNILAGGVRLEDDVYLGPSGPELLSDGRTDLLELH